MNKHKIIIIALAVSLFAISQYVLYDKITESKQQEMTNVFQQGYNKGLTDAVSTLYQQTGNCHSTTITLGNFTRNIVDLACTQNYTKVP